MLLRLSPVEMLPAAWYAPEPRSRAREDTARAKVCRLYALGIPAGGTRSLRPLPGRMTVHCRSGRVWITHDGEFRDVVLDARESYRVDSDRLMRLHALDAAGVEIQIDGSG